MLFGEETQLFARVDGSSVAVLWEWIRSSDHIIDVIKFIITNQFRLSEKKRPIQALPYLRCCTSGYGRGGDAADPRAARARGRVVDGDAVSVNPASQGCS
jgi:hypothetical protein